MPRTNNVDHAAITASGNFVEIICRSLLSDEFPVAFMRGCDCPFLDLMRLLRTFYYSTIQTTRDIINGIKIMADNRVTGLGTITVKAILFDIAIDCLLLTSRCSKSNYD